MLEELLESQPLNREEETELLDELVPELRVICENLWVLELVVDYCKRRADA